MKQWRLGYASKTVPTCSWTHRGDPERWKARGCRRWSPWWQDGRCLGRRHWQRTGGGAAPRCVGRSIWCSGKPESAAEPPDSAARAAGCSTDSAPPLDPTASLQDMKVNVQYPTWRLSGGCSSDYNALKVIFIWSRHLSADCYVRHLFKISVFSVLKKKPSHFWPKLVFYFCEYNFDYLLCKHILTDRYPPSPLPMMTSEGFQFNLCKENI